MSLNADTVPSIFLNFPPRASESTIKLSSGLPTHTFSDETFSSSKFVESASNNSGKDDSGEEVALTSMPCTNSDHSLCLVIVSVCVTTKGCLCWPSEVVEH